MYTIGKFARLGMVSAAALRFYDDIGLLKPSRIDASNGYRYYTQAQLEDVLFINEMREFGFSLEEIKLFLPHRDTEGIVPALQLRLDELFREEQRVAYLRRRLRGYIDRLKGDHAMNKQQDNMEQIDIRVIDLEQPMLSAGIYVSIPQWPPANFEELGSLWSRYWEEDIGANMLNRVFPPAQFGVLTMVDGEIRYLAAERVGSTQGIPQEYMRFEVPAGTYAVCTFRAPTFEQLTGERLQQANAHFASWLPQSGYEYGGGFALEVYDERCRRRDDNPEMDIYMPLKRAEGAQA